MDKDANIKKEWFGRTVIHSDHRFSYEGAQEVLETKQGPFAKELNLLNDLSTQAAQRTLQARSR
jgi:ribonuclease R